MVYILLAIALGAAGYFGLRYFLLKRSLKKVDAALHELTGNLTESRMVKLPSPDNNIESLLKTINAMLDEIRSEAIEQRYKEAALKLQVESISHDLRTPLTSIQGYLSLIDASDLNDESIEALEVVRKKADSLQRLIVQFYELSQLEDTGSLLDVRSCDVAGILRESLTEHYQTLTKNGSEVDVKIPEGRIEALVDPDALERICANLIENASRYALSRIDIEALVFDRSVQVSFSNDCDLGEDTEPEALFTPFYIGHTSRPQGSSGLGLSIARQLAESMNASLEATLGQEKDSQMIKFILTLPRN